MTKGRILLGTGVVVAENGNTNKANQSGGIFVSSSGILKMTTDVIIKDNYSVSNEACGIYAQRSAQITQVDGNTNVDGNSSILNNVYGNKVGCTFTDKTKMASYSGVYDVMYLNEELSKQYARISVPDIENNQSGITGACNALITGGTIYLGKTDDTSDMTWKVTGTVKIENTGTLAIQSASVNNKKAVITGNKQITVLSCNNSGTLALTNLGITGGKGNCNTNCGGGIYKDGNAALTLDNCSVYGNTADGSGGGLYVNKGTVTLKDTIIGIEVSAIAGDVAKGKQVKNAQASSSASNANSALNGGGIYIKAGEVDLTGTSAVADNYACKDSSNNAGQGGGVYIYDGVLKIGTATNENESKAQIYANGSENAGGAVYGIGGIVYIYGSIHHNIAADSAGLCTKVAVMYSTASIRDNYNSSNNPGGCVSLTAAANRFTMEGGTISNNGSKNTSCSQYEVFVTAGIFTMKNSAVIKSTDNAYNGVYLAQGQYITVSGTLTPSSNTAAGSPLLSAMIIPNKYISTSASETIQILQATNESELTAALPCFDVVHAGGCIIAGSDTSKGYLNCVSKYGNNYYYSLGLAMNAAASGGTVTLVKDFTMASPLTLDKTLVLDIDANHTITRSSKLTASPLFIIPKNCSLTLNTQTATKKLVIDGGGSNVSASLIQNEGSLTIYNTKLKNNKNSNSGGAVYNKGTLSLSTGSEITGCKASNGGGIYSETGAVYINDTALVGSTNTVNLTASSSYVSNTATNGGGLYIAGGVLTIYKGTIQQNWADCGGGLYICKDCTSFSCGNADYCPVISYNGSYSGGGAYIACRSATISNIEMKGNRATGGSYTGGGGIEYNCTGGNLNISGGRIGGDGDEHSANIAYQFGGGIYVRLGTLTLSGSAVIGKESSSAAGDSFANEARKSGGGVFIGNENANICMESGSKVCFNSANNGGGGICDVADSTSANGGIEIKSGAFVLNNYTFNNHGGGIFVQGHRGTIILNGTVSGNILNNTETVKDSHDYYIYNAYALTVNSKTVDSFPATK